jgi:hypothetical protein
VALYVTCQIDIGGNQELGITISRAETCKENSSDYVRAGLHEKFPRQEPVAVALILTVAAERQKGVMRQRRLQVQFRVPIRARSSLDGTSG